MSKGNKKKKSSRCRLENQFKAERRGIKECGDITCNKKTRASSTREEKNVTSI